MNSIAINLRTGRPAKWPKYPYNTGTDKAEFYCVWKAKHYILASLSDHIRKKVPATHNLLIETNRADHVLAPKGEVRVSYRI